jgi:predicted Fe-Mo cluster-binding NifX family protein
MKKRIAIPMAGNLLSEHFGHCRSFAYVDVENNVITNIEEMDPPEHQPGTYPRWVANNGATDVIAGGMGPMAVNLFNESGVNVFVGAPLDTPTNLVTNFIAGKLTLNANYCDHHGDDHNHNHHHEHHD